MKEKRDLNGMRPILVYAADVNLLGKNANTPEKNTELY
jgi:hypothetical protein